MGVGSVVIGSGAHVAMVVMVDSASGVGKSFINGIVEVQTNLTL